jgi:hypothetical protein
MYPTAAVGYIIERVRDEMSTIWPITEFTESKDREVTEIFKIRCTPKKKREKVWFNQYHALQMTTKPGEECTRIKKTKLLTRLNPIWMKQQFDAKFLSLVQTASLRPGLYRTWIYVSVGDTPEGNKAPSNLVMTKFPVHYTQKNHDICLFKSVASALHHQSKKEIASVISSMATKHMYAPIDVQLNQLYYVAQEKTVSCY